MRGRWLQAFIICPVEDYRSLAAITVACLVVCRDNFFGIPGVGLGITLFLLIGIGFIASGWLDRFLSGITDGILVKTPVVSSLYFTLKQLLNTLLGENSTSLHQVALVRFPPPGAWSTGFVTGTVDTQQGFPDILISVFVPTTPNPTCGFLTMVTPEEVHYSPTSVEQAQEMVVSLGMTG